MPDTILVTGGAGYIGSHTVLALMKAGFKVVVLDNLINSSFDSMQRVGSIVGKEPVFIKGDIRDNELLGRLFKRYPIRSVIHFAGLKAVSESVNNPLDYYDVNVSGTVALCRAMSSARVFNFVFSSSATVYGAAACVPIAETESADRAANPYGRSKRMVENILSDTGAADKRWHIAILRYFNPIGAHESGMIGESPNGVPNNLLPYVAHVAMRKLPELRIFGNDYKTHDGTGVRDYIHVMDLADGHLKALEKIDTLHGTHTWNLGTGLGYSVFDVLNAFEKASGKTIPYRVVERRAGDVGLSFADPSKAKRELQWTAKRGLDEMMTDTWRWQSLNPNGYD